MSTVHILKRAVIFIEENLRLKTWASLNVKKNVVKTQSNLYSKTHFFSLAKYTFEIEIQGVKYKTHTNNIEMIILTKILKPKCMINTHHF